MVYLICYFNIFFALFVLCFTCLNSVETIECDADDHYMYMSITKRF